MICLGGREIILAWRKSQIVWWSAHGRILSQDDRYMKLMDGACCGENEKSRISKECGLEIFILAMPLPYAGITQVRYEGRPKCFGHLSINAPLAM